MTQHKVRAWEETVYIPTYPIGAPEKNPMFLEKRVYQGSSGVVYPHAVIEKIYNEKSDRAYRAVYMENSYIKIMILPELGGRIQMAYDKVKQRHFVYYNQVIKPALVGLTGPWISGGIEFNWPQHHRPSTFEAVDFTIQENEDGSKTVWVNEVERMFRTKGMAGFTLHPERAYIEIKGRIYNRTPFPQTFLWWANPAVKVNDDYQSIFPPDVYAVFDHGKRDVSSFPIAKGVYYKVDYAPGTDISRYKNIPVPTSYMAVSSQYDFIGGYEHDTQGGLLHVADHHVAPGKKQWTWGNGAFGVAWDKNLTDEDGPYIELMTGVHTDNQPDFSWLQPYEEKTFTQYFMPYREVGQIKNATKNAAVNIETDANNATIKLYTTAPYENVELKLYADTELVYSEVFASSPENPYIKTIPLLQELAQSDIHLVVTNKDSGKELVSYRGEEPQEIEPPLPAQAALPPADVENNEQLYLTGLHLEQYRHATFLPTDYYLEALRRDPKDARSNNAMGLWYLRRGQFAKSEPYFRAAVATLTQRNPNPYDGEAYYNLGWALKLQYKNEEAFNAFYKSVWNDAWQHAGYFNLARLATAKGDYVQALELVDKSIVRNYNSHSARHAKVFILRKLGMIAKALAFAEESLINDPFNFGCMYEKYLLLKYTDALEADKAQEQLKTLSRGWEHNFIEYALDYAHTGLYDDAIDFLGTCPSQEYALLPYYMGWFSYMAGNTVAALKYYQKGAAAHPDFVFPNRIEEVLVLTAATNLNPQDSKAYYYLGNFWYDKRQYRDAIACWEKSVSINDSFPTVWRNLSLAYHNKSNDPARSLHALTRAFALDNTDARVLMEFDQLKKKMNTALTERLQFLELYTDLVCSRDDLYLEWVTLHNQLGNYIKAKELISNYKFHPWEGGEGKVVKQYLICHLELAKQTIAQGNYSDALKLLEAAEEYPENLGEGKLVGTQENDIHYWKGRAHKALGNEALAIEWYQMATNGISEPVQAIFYNDPQPDKIFYQGLAWEQLGNYEKAQEIFKKLVDFGLEHMDDTISIDYFAVSLPDLLVFDANLDERNSIHCLYLTALGNLGLYLEKADAAELLFDKVLKLDVNHQGAMVHKLLPAYLAGERFAN